MKRIFTILVAALLIFGFGNSAQATFYGGAVGNTTEMGIELGDTTTGLTETTVSGLFDVNDIGSTFDGVSSLADITVGGVGLNYELVNRNASWDVWFAVEEGTTADEITTSYGLLTTIQSNISYIGQNTFTDGFYTSSANSNAMSGIVSGGDLNGFTSYVSNTTLADLAIGNDVAMDIWMFDNAATNNEGDDTLSATNYQLVFSIDENTNMVSASLTQVPVPGALILMVTGLLTAVGVRRKKA